MRMAFQQFTHNLRFVFFIVYGLFFYLFKNQGQILKKVFQLFFCGITGKTEAKSTKVLIIDLHGLEDMRGFKPPRAAGGSGRNTDSDLVEAQQKRTGIYSGKSNTEIIGAPGRK